MKYFYTKHKKIKGFTQLVDFGFVFEIVKDNFCKLFCKIDKSITMAYSKLKTVKISKPKFTTGFTVIELLTVIAIIGFISAIVYSNLQDARKRALETKVVEEIDQLSKAFELYKADKGTYPGESTSILKENDYVISYLSENLVELKYIPTIPQYGDTDSTIYYAYYAGEDVKPDAISGKNIQCVSKIINDYIFIFETDRSVLDLKLQRVLLDEGSVISGYCIGQ